MPDYIKSIDFYKGVTIVRITGSVTLSNLTETQAEFRAKLKVLGFWWGFGDGSAGNPRPVP